MYKHMYTYCLLLNAYFRPYSNDSNSNRNSNNNNNIIAALLVLCLFQLVFYVTRFLLYAMYTIIYYLRSRLYFLLVT